MHVHKIEEVNTQQKGVTDLHALEMLFGLLLEVFAE